MLYYGDVDRVFQALADPNRRRMVEHLAAGPLSVSALGAPLEISLAAVVQHVQALEACGIVSTKKTGRTRLCTINPAALAAAESWFSARRAEWEVCFNRLEDFLRDEKGNKK